MNKDDLIKDFMSDISHKVLMQKYNLTKYEFDQFRTANQLDKDDRYILKDKAILEDCFAGYPDQYVMQKHNITMQKLKRCLRRAYTCIEELDECKCKRINTLYQSGTSIDEISHEYDYEYSTVEYVINKSIKEDLKTRRNKNIVESYKAGTEIAELITAYGINTKSINKILRDNNINIRK